MAQIFLHTGKRRGQPGGLENNVLTLLLSASKEDDPGMPSETCLPPLLHAHLVTLLKVT